MPAGKTSSSSFSVIATRECGETRARCSRGRYSILPPVSGCRRKIPRRNYELRRARRSPVTQKRIGHERGIVIDVCGRIRRNIFWTFGGRGRFFRGGRGRVGRVLGHQTLLEALVLSSRLRSSRASGQKGEAEQTKSGFDFHWTRKS